MRVASKSKCFTNLKKAFLKTTMVMSFMGWVYSIMYQFAFPIGITEGHPLGHLYPLSEIRMDDFGVLCFVLFGIAFFLWNYLYVDGKSNKLLCM